MAASGDVFTAWAEQSRGPLVLGLTWTFTSLGLIFVGCRIFVQGAVRRKLNVDDWLSVLSIALILVSEIITTVAISYGLGKHLTTLTTFQAQHAVLYFMIASFIGVPTLGVGKLAAIALLTRLLNPTRLHFWILWASGAVSVAFLFSVQAVFFFQCRPVNALWDMTVKGTCISPVIQLNLSYATASFSALLDFYLAIYPATQVLQLKLSLKKRLGVTAALGVGFIAGALAIFKTVELQAITSGDITYDFCVPHMWTIVETSIVLIAACIPVLQPLLDLLRGKNVFKTGGSYPSTDQPHSFSRKYGDGGIEMSSRSRAIKDPYGFTTYPNDSDGGQTDGSQRQFFNFDQDDEGQSTPRSDRSLGKESQTVVHITA